MTATDIMAGSGELTTSLLSSLTFEFGPAAGDPYATQMRLHADGRIGGYANPNEFRWAWRGPHPAFLDRANQVTTLFDRATRQDGRLVLEGDLTGGGQHHVLREVDPIARLLPPGAGLAPTSYGGQARRPNLVVLRAGRASLHTEWARDIHDSDRSWDLCVSWYDDPDVFKPDPDAAWHAIQGGVRKYEALHQLLDEASPFWAYDYVMFPDDDLAWSWRGVNLAFSAMREFDLMLAQPSLEPAGFPTHEVTKRLTGTRLHFTNFVEVMTPIFSREALGICAPTFALSRSAFGLDHVWPLLLGDPANRIAVIDDTGIVHTRPLGVGYDVQAAVAEGHELLRAYRARQRFDCIGSIEGQI